MFLQFDQPWNVPLFSRRINFFGTWLPGQPGLLPPGQGRLAPAAWRLGGTPGRNAKVPLDREALDREALDWEALKREPLKREPDGRPGSGTVTMGDLRDGQSRQVRRGDDPEETTPSRGSS